MKNVLPRAEYPRPQLEREKYLILNGVWDFDFDDENIGLSKKYYLNKKYTRKITVPFTFETLASGINIQDAHDYLWYERMFDIPSDWKDQHIILNFQAVDYYCKVYVNGEMVGEHVGGQTAFSFDITSFAKEKDNRLTLYVYDPAHDQTIPRGKQTWEDKPSGIWYDRTSGIWQSVWLEPVSDNHITNLLITPNYDHGKVFIKGFTALNKGKVLIKVIGLEKIFGEAEVDVSKNSFEATLDVFKGDIFKTAFHGAGLSWSPDHPFLFDLDVTLVDDEANVDHVTSYFGMRKIEIRGDKIFLNNREYYERLVLDQGYFKDGMLTATSDEDFINDIKLTKALGFNGVRKHQKVEDQRYLYHADRLGLLVWGECASVPRYSVEGLKNTIRDWMEIIPQYYSHPSIITWVPFNESWGINEISARKDILEFALGAYHLVKAMDPTRPVIGNDGWEMAETDICAIHNYHHGAITDTKTREAYKNSLTTLDGLLSAFPAQREIFIQGYKYNNQPILLTEYGGIAFAGDKKNWGYTCISTIDEYLSELKDIHNTIYSSKYIKGFCYTQLTDVMQECNGLLTFDRKEKAPIEELRDIIENR